MPSVNVDALLADLRSQPLLLCEDACDRIRALSMKDDQFQITDEMIASRIRSRPVTRSPIAGDIAFIPVEGMIFRRYTWATYMLDGCGCDVIQEQIASALADPTIGAIVLLIDSPGGMVSGTFELAQWIFDQRDKKPFAAFSPGTIGSGAYLLGAAAGEITITTTAMAGSIGTVRIFRDKTRQLDQMGVQETVIRSGSQKMVPSGFEKLDQATFSVLNRQLEAIDKLFVTQVGRYMDRSPDFIKSKFGDGAVYMGQAAVDVGLVHRLGSLDGVVQELLGRRSSGTGQLIISEGANSMADSATANTTQIPPPAAGAQAAATSPPAAGNESAAALTAANAQASAGQPAGSPPAAMVKGELLELRTASPLVDGGELEHTRVTTIMAKCNQAGFPELAPEFIKNRFTVAQVSDSLLDKMIAKNTPVGSPANAGGPETTASSAGDVDKRFKDEFKANPHFAASGISEAAYVATRRIDEGIDQLMPDVLKPKT